MEIPTVQLWVQLGAWESYELPYITGSGAEPPPKRFQRNLISISPLLTAVDIKFFACVLKSGIPVPRKLHVRYAGACPLNSLYYSESITLMYSELIFL